jgi:uncharacterized RDD family membrane protein YckC
VLTSLNPLSKLVVCCIWLVAAVLVFDPLFQLAAILAPALALIVLHRTSPLVLLALMVPFALFGFGFLTTRAISPCAWQVNPFSPRPSSRRASPCSCARSPAA